MLTSAAAGAAAMKLMAWLAAIVSGGSSVSWSVTWSPMTRKVQVSSAVNVPSGSRSYVLELALTVKVAVWAPLVAQLSVNQVPATSTGSVNVTDRLASSATPVAPSVGVVDWTAGA